MIGCSGSGGSSDSVSTSLTTLEGTFVDGPVQGLSYTGRLSGVTNEDGRYSYQGEDLKVEFGLGDLSLGELTPSPNPVSPVDFFEGLPIEHEKVVNLLRLLQSLDVDGDASNGITITSDSIEALKAALIFLGYDLTTIDFSILSTEDLTVLLLEVISRTVADDRVVSEAEALAHATEEILGTQPVSPSTEINGTALASCDGVYLATDDFAKDYNASDAEKRNVSSSGTSEEDVNFNKEDPTSHNTIERVGFTVLARDANGTEIIPNTYVHPIVISYGQQVVGEFEMGDGSADIGDPDNRDALFFAKSLDNGDTWQNVKISNSELKSSTKVDWGTTTDLEYKGHIQKPTMAIEGNNILLAWNDKYCPSGNPFNLAVAEDDNKSYPDDFFSVNGTQGSIEYDLDGSVDPLTGELLLAPNGKEVYEVPFSCVWTARGIMDGAGIVTWQRPMQLTSGVRDSNHIWIEGSEAGFAMSWQEDTEGLRSGKGAGPGEGWSGATTNHGTEIWYTSIKATEFGASIDDGTDDRQESENNFHYPVRITDNEICSTTDKKAYCSALCTEYGSEIFTTGNNAEEEINRCYTSDVDMLDNTRVVLNGDTGASRPTLRILKTDADGEYVVVLAYEETKGLSEHDTGTGDQDQGDADTIIEFEGKSVYFESFNFNAINSFDVTANDFNVSDLNTTILQVAMPLISAGNIVNVKVPAQDNQEHYIYENARRVVIGTHIDSCKANNFTFALLYKQGFDVQGTSSDMFVRVNNGFTYDSFVALNDPNIGDLNVTNVSAQADRLVVDINDYNVSWLPENLTHNTYVNSYENTFSPRLFLRGDGNDGNDSGDGIGGDDIFVGFAYTPNSTVIVEGEGSLPSNFHTHIYLNGQWQGPVNVTQVVVPSATTVDARFFTTPKGSVSGLASDLGNPNVLFTTWGEIGWTIDGKDGLGKTETDLFYKRALYDAVNKVWVWDTNASKLSAIAGGVVEEKEVESFASPDGKTIYNVWLQESDPVLVQQYETQKQIDISDHAEGVDSWFGRIDYNISITP